MNESQWHEVLTDAGFEPRIQIRQTGPEAGHDKSAFIASARPQSEVDCPPDQKYLIVYSSRETSGYDLAKGLVVEIGNLKHSSCSMVELGEISPASLEGSVCISILELGGIDLSELNGQEFSKIKLLVNTCQDLLWVTGDPEQSPKAAMATGLIRSVRWERDLETVNFAILQIHSPFPKTKNLSNEIGRICYETFDPTGTIPRNSELTLKDGMVLTNRLMPKQAINSCLNSNSEFVARRQALGDIETPLKLITYESGNVKTLGFIEDHAVLDELKPDEVRVEVQAVHLSRQELIQISELIPGKGVGKDGAGIIKAVGSAVKDMAVGDSVMFIRSAENGGSFATSLIADQRTLMRIPPDMSFSEAAAIPFAYCTAYLCLVDMANLDPHMTVVIQSAAEEVGQAAVQLVKGIGASVIALAPSQRDKDLLVERYELPPSHVLCVEDTSISTSILSLTGGKGADIVLGTRSPRGQCSDMSYVSSFGHVIYLQRAESRASSNKFTPTTTSNVTYSFVTIDEFWIHKPNCMFSIFAAVAGLLAKRQIRPPQPVRSMAFSEVKSAIEEARKGDGLERVVFTPQKHDMVPVSL